jgi:hypothetical protein
MSEHEKFRYAQLEENHRFRANFRKTYFRKYVTGSAFWAVRYDMLILWSFVLLWSFLFDYLIEDQFEFFADVFTISIIFSSATFFATLYVLVERQLYVDVVAEYDNFNSVMLAFAGDFFTLMSSKASCKESKECMLIVNQIKNIICSMPLAIVDQHSSIDEGYAILPPISISLCKDTRPITILPNNLNIEVLPMPEDLLQELNSYELQPNVELMIDMVKRRTAILTNDQFISDRIWHRFSQLMDMALRQNYAIKANKRVGITPPIKGVVTITIYVWSIILPWFLWNIFRYNMLWVWILLVWPIIALIGVGRVLENPFLDYVTSDYAYIDLRLMSQDIFDMIHATYAKNFNCQALSTKIQSDIII